MAGRSRYSNAAALAEATALSTLPDGGSIKVYSGVQPATADTALSGNTLLATLTLPTPSFTVSVNVLTAAVIAAATIAASGVANWFRCLKSDGTTAVFDGNIGNQTVTLSAGVSASATSISVTALSQPVYAGQTLQFTDAVSAVLKAIQVTVDAAAGATSVACSAAAAAIATASVSGQNMTINNPNLQVAASLSVSSMTVTLSQSGT